MNLKLKIVSKRRPAYLFAIMLVLAVWHFASPGYRRQVNFPRDQTSALLAASAVNNMQAIRNLIDSGANVNGHDVNRWRPLHFAAHENYCEQINLLIESGAMLEVKTNFGWTPLHWAVYQNNHEAAQTLLRHHADSNAVNIQGNTPMHLCAFMDNPRMAALLLRHGADVNKKNNSGSTPLDYAVHQNALPTAEFLLKSNADPTSGKTRQPSAAADTQRPLARAAMLGLAPMTSLLLRYDSDINASDPSGHTALHDASKHDRGNTIMLLLAAGIDPLQKNNSGETAADLSSNPDLREAMRRPLQTQAKRSDKDADQGNVVLPSPLERKF